MARACTGLSRNYLISPKVKGGFCRLSLSANGVLASNLYSTPVHLHISRLARNFAGQVLVLSEPQRSNQVVIA